MWAIRGYVETWEPYNKSAYTFDTEEAATEYLDAAKLKAPKWKRRYKAKSGLAHYDNCYVEYIEQPYHNPEITF